MKHPLFHVQSGQKTDAWQNILASSVASVTNTRYARPRSFYHWYQPCIELQVQFLQLCYIIIIANSTNTIVFHNYCECKVDVNDDQSSYILMRPFPMYMEQFQQPPVHQNSVGLIKSDTKRVAVVPTHISSDGPEKAAAEGVFGRGQTEGWEHLMHITSLQSCYCLDWRLL